MASYSVGIQTKKRIFEKCKELFYENGFDDTSFQDISEALNINKGLLPYHFGTKNNIAREILDEFINNQRNAALEAIDTDDRSVATITSLMLFYTLILEDEKLKRFWVEVAVANVNADIEFWNKEVFLHSIVEADKIDISEEELFTIYCIENGMEIEVMKNFAIGLITEPLTKVFRKQYTATLFLLGLSNERINDILTQSGKLASNIRAKRIGCFEVEYEMINN